MAYEPTQENNKARKFFSEGDGTRCENTGLYCS